MVYWTFLGLGVFMGLQSCQQPTAVSVGAIEKPFFDLKAYFENEKTHLKTRSNFTKTTVVNGKQEEKKIEALNFEEELRLFVEADINRPAWVDKYQVDSTFEGTNLKQITYSTKEERLVVKSITIDFEKEEITKITIQKEAETALANSQFRLSYEPNKGYSIDNKQQLKVGEDIAFLVSVFYE